MEASLRRVRPYCRSLLRVLRCHQDVQWWHGKGALLNYVTTYTTKFTEKWDGDLALHAEDHWKAGDLYTKYWKCAQPQMAMVLGRSPMVWHSAMCKPFRVPWNLNALPPSYHCYCCRPSDEEHVTYTQWLRLYRQVGSASAGTARMQKYMKAGKQLVALGAIYSSIKKDIFFWQWLLMHVPHRSDADLQVGCMSEVDLSLQWYCSAIHLKPEIWSNNVWIQEYLERRGHKSNYIQSTMARLAADRFLIQGQLSGFFPVHRAPPPIRPPSTTLNSEQKHIVNRLRQELRKRDAIETTDEQTHVQVDNALTFFITGPPGVGKSMTVAQWIMDAAADGKRVLIATPAAKLGAQYRYLHPNITVTTVHKAFNIPVDTLAHEPWPLCPWLACYDIIIVDECSLLPEVIFDHMMRCWFDLGMFPMLVLCGDFCQLQPIGLPGMRAKNATCSKLWRQIVTLELTTQMRCICPELITFLSLIRTDQPSEIDVSGFLKGVRRIEFNASDVQSVMEELPHLTFLAASKRAVLQLNSWCVSLLMDAHTSFGCIEVWDEDMSSVVPMHVFHGMRLILTFNQIPGRDLINGQAATLETRIAEGLVIRLPCGAVQILPPTFKWDPEHRHLLCGFHVSPGYALTVYKAQGVTLRSAAVYLDTANASGLGYVAYSRVKRKRDLIIIGKVSPCHFVPVVV